MPSLQRKIPRNFRYRKVDSSNHKIRVVWIRPDLTHDGLIEFRLKHVGVGSQHACLSYTWGSTEPRKQILINGGRFYVRLNLWKFLDLARWRNETQPIWIDAICIDQDNIEERNHQVQMMGDIYRSATEVLVWLGEGEGGIEVALKMMDREWMRRPRRLETIERDFRSQLGLRRSSVKSFKRAVAELSALPYWDRVWIKQEIMLNENVRFLYGRSQSNFPNAFLCQCNGSDWCSDHHAYAAGQTMCMKMFAFCAWGPSLDNLRPLQELVTLFSGSACSEVRDRVYGFLSMALEGNTFEVDYAICTTELFMRTLSLARPTGSLDTTYLQYLLELVNNLRLSDQDLQEEKLRPLKEKYTLNDYSFDIELDPLAVFANSRFRQATWMDVSARLKLDRTPDRLLYMTTDVIHEAKSGNGSDREEVSYGARFPNLGVPSADLHRTILSGNDRLLSGDIIFRVGPHYKLSNLFLVGRLREHRNLALEIVAVAESDRPIQCFHSGPHCVDDGSRIKFKVFDTPNCIKCTSMTLKVKQNDPKYLVGAEVAFDITSIALLVRLLCAGSNDNEKETWSWRTEEMSPMREVVFSKIWTHEGRTAKRKPAAEALTDSSRRSKPKR